MKHAQRVAKSARRARLREPSTSPAWLNTHAGIEARGRELGIAARPGESYEDYKNRLLRECPSEERK